MSNHRPSLEKIAPSVEEAIAQGAAELGVSKEALEVEILDEGSKGIFGLGTRQARVRLTLLKPGIPPSAKKTEAPTREDADAAALLEALSPEDLEAVRACRDTVM
ncbi:MAG: Jag N-terminal domain-containing protein, partial [Anaerolineales bacterium]